MLSRLSAVAIANDSLNVECFRTNVLFMWPLDRAEGDIHLFEIIQVFQFAKDFMIQIGLASNLFTLPSLNCKSKEKSSLAVTAVILFIQSRPYRLAGLCILISCGHCSSFRRSFRFCFKCCLRRRQTGHGNAEGRTAHIIQSNFVAERN